MLRLDPPPAAAEQSLRALPPDLLPNLDGLRDGALANGRGVRAEGRQGDILSEQGARRESQRLAGHVYLVTSHSVVTSERLMTSWPP